MVGGRLDEFLEPFELLLRGLALPLRNEQLLRLLDDHDAPRRHHRQRGGGVEQVVDADVAAVQAIDAERPQALLDQVRKLPRHRRLLHVVLADQHVQRPGLSGGELLPKRGGCDWGHAGVRRLREWR
jgi:hypothetical protein